MPSRVVGRQSLNEPMCVGESSHISLRDQLFKAFLLPLGIRDGLPFAALSALVWAVRCAGRLPTIISLHLVLFCRTFAR